MEPLIYTPTFRETPRVFSLYPSAWGNIPTILNDIIKRFNVKRNTCLEFGVEYGYSTSALSNYFKKVIGVDTFTGDIHAGIVSDHYQRTKSLLERDYGNIHLIQSSYQDYAKTCSEKFDMIHIDIVHDYENTFACGDWSCQHSDVVIFHDTLSFPTVMKSCIDLSEKHEMTFYNYEESYGLGILVRENLI